MENEIFVQLCKFLDTANGHEFEIDMHWFPKPFGTFLVLSSLAAYCTPEYQKVRNGTLFKLGKIFGLC
jgi:hypothetical protein